MTTEQRLERMERELGRAKRRNRWLLGALVVCVGVVVFAASIFAPAEMRAQPTAGVMTVVRANRFVLEDAKGRERAALEMRKHGEALVLIDEEGDRRAMLGAQKSGPGLKLYDDLGTAKLGASENGPELALWGRQGGIELTDIAYEMPRLILYGKGRQRRAVLRALQEYHNKSTGSREGGPGLWLFGEDGKAKILLGVHPSGPNLALWGKESDKDRARVEVREDKPQIRLYDEKHNPVWSAP